MIVYILISYKLSEVGRKLGASLSKGVTLSGPVLQGGLSADSVSGEARFMRVPKVQGDFAKSLRQKDR